MIVRIFCAKVRKGKEKELLQAVERVAIPLVKSQKGMLQHYAGKPTASNANEFVMVTVWENLDALKKFAGEDWEKAVIPKEELELLESSLVHHYEVIGE